MCALLPTATLARADHCNRQCRLGNLRGPPGRRMIPGLGMGVHPPLLDESYVDGVVMVEEVDTIRACRRLARSGFLFGGSTGTVVSGAMDWLAQHDERHELTAVAIAPDLGERYLTTIYQSNWLKDVYGEDTFEVDELNVSSWSSDKQPHQQPTMLFAR
nr:hypothetical protein [Reticulibacter mediterranei]